MGPPSVGFTRKVVSVQLQKVEVERLKREEYHRVKHDKLFSDWKILVGPLDWKSHAASEEGSQRYHLHNLPNTYFGPGVYELGLTSQNLSTPRASRPRKIRRQDVIVVYVGQAENVRQRLQTYGQSGSHLEGARLVPRSVEDRKYDHQRNPLPVQNANGKADVTTGGGLRLFTEVFSRGYSIVFRWAKTETKQMAEKVEAELLQVFDYPWNRGLNGARRPADIFARLEVMQYHLGKTFCLGSFLTVRPDLFVRRVGVKVLVRKPSEHQNMSVSRFSVFREKDGQPKDESKSGILTCGVLLENGSSCSKSPVKGRRRCSEHKGLRAKLTTRRPRISKSTIAESGGKMSTDSSGDNDRGGNPPVLLIKSTPTGKRLELSDASDLGNLPDNVCGIIQDNGSLCSKIPVKGRRRCAAHKGMHTKANSTTSPQPSERQYLRGIPLPD